MSMIALNDTTRRDVLRVLREIAQTKKEECNKSKRFKREQLALNKQILLKNPSFTNHITHRNITRNGQGIILHVRT
jgi:hypothetical protein